MALVFHLPQRAALPTHLQSQVIMANSPQGNQAKNLYFALCRLTNSADALREVAKGVQHLYEKQGAAQDDDWDVAFSGAELSDDRLTWPLVIRAARYRLDAWWKAWDDTNRAFAALPFEMFDDATVPVAQRWKTRLRRALNNAEGFVHLAMPVYQGDELNRATKMFVHLQINAGVSCVESYFDRWAKDISVIADFINELRACLQCDCDNQAEPSGDANQDSLIRIERSIPQYDPASDDWISNRSTARLLGVETETLANRRHKKRETKSEDGSYGCHDRVCFWRKRGE